MKIREDIFPKIEAQDILQGLANLAFQSFRGLFSSKDDVIQYINSFENPKIALLFLEVGEYYYFAKFYYCPNCFPSKKIENCSYCKKPFEMPAYIVLIMIISIMEQLSAMERQSRRFNEYMDFFDWTGKKEIITGYQANVESGKIEDFGEFVSTLREDWRRDYGSVTKITEFFEKFLNKEEKIEFVKSIKYLIKAPELPPKHMGSIEGKTIEKTFANWRETIEKENQILFTTDEDVKKYVENSSKTTWEALPICFDEEQYWKCYSIDSYGHGLGYCRYECYCPVIHDERLLNRCFNKIVKTIYDWRSAFVHKIRIPPIREVATIGDFYENKHMVVELTTTKLKPIFEKMLKRYFDQFQKKD